MTISGAVAAGMGPSAGPIGGSPTGWVDYINSPYYGLYGAPGAHQYSPASYSRGRPLWNKDVWNQAKEAGYFENPTGGIWGSSGGYTVSPKQTDNTFNYPTSQELWNTAYNLQPFQQQRSILGQMATPQAFQQSINPYMQSLLQSLRGRGMQSSSYADKNIANTLGSLWQNNQTNMLSGWQNMMSQMPGVMQMWQQPYSTVLGML